MSRSITIRNVPDETVDELAARAARGGRSLQEYLRTMLVEVTARPDMDEFWARVEEQKRRSNTRLDTSFILEALHADRR